jgi:hypothetical protein
MADQKVKRERKIPKIECQKTQCNQNLHCFLDSPKLKSKKEHLASPIAVTESSTLASNTTSKDVEQRRCWNCGVALIDWDRIHHLDLNDVEYTFNCLKCEYIRHQYWHKELDVYAVNQAKRRGRGKMPQYAENRIKNSVAAAQPRREKRQTPVDGDILYYAQHATATCCRSCMEVWHGIPQGVELTEKQVQFCTALLMKYVDERMPDLPEASQYVPSIRNKK